MTTIPTHTRPISLPDHMPEYAPTDHTPVLAAKLRKLAEAGYVTLAPAPETGAQA